MLRLILVLLFMVLAGPSWATTYYVSTTGDNTNSGTSESSPWRTVRHAVTTMLPGDTTYVRGGTYIEGNMRFSRSGTASAPIKLLAYPGEYPIIDCNRAGTNMLIVQHAQGDLVPMGYITIEGFEIRNCYCGIKYLHMHDSVIRRNWIHHNRTQGILGNSGVRNLIDSNIINSNGSSSQFDHGLYANGSNHTVINNLIYDNLCFGIQLNGSKSYDPARHPGVEFEESKNWIVAKNTIAYNRSCAGIVIWGGNADNLRVENNIFYENRQIGTSGQTNAVSCTSATGSTGILIRNNLSYATGTGGTLLMCTSLTEGVHYTQSGNVVNTSNPDFVNGGDDALPASPDFRLLSTSPAINMGRNNEFPKNGTFPDAGAFETVGTPTAAITNNVITLTFPMSVNTPIQVPSTTGVSISCTPNPTACPSSPAVTAAVRRPGTDSFVEVSISGIAGNVCKTGQDWKISYNSATGSWTDSARRGPYPGLNQKIFSFTNLPVTNVCDQAPPPTPTIGSLTPSTLTIQNGQNGTLTVALNATQATNTVVALSSSVPGVATVPANVTVLAGQLSAIFTVTSVANGTTDITATLNGTATSTVTVESSPPPPPTPAVVSLLPASINLNVAATVNLTININAAQATNTNVTLSSSNPAIASIPASATVLAGNTSVVATVTGVSPGTVVITATLNGTATSTVTVVTPPPPPPPTNPLLWYKFEDNVNDSSGNANHGSQSGGSFVDGHTDKGFQAASGTTNKVTTAYGGGVNPTTQSFTVAFWAYIPPGAANLTAGLFGPPNGSSLSDTRRMAIATVSGTWRVNFQGGSTTASNLSVTEGWNHVCVNSNSATDSAVLWINGVQGTTGGAVDTFTSFTFISNFIVGEPNSLVGSFPASYIYDDVKVWTSIESCLNDFNSITPPPPPPTSGHVAVTATRFYGIKTVASALNPLAANNTGINVPPGGAFALALQADCTVGDCSTRSFKLFYSCALCPSMGAVLSVPDVATADSLEFLGTSPETGQIEGGHGGNLSGGLTHVDGGTNITASAIPSLSLAQNNSTVIRFLLRLNETAVVGHQYCPLLRDQSGLALDGHVAAPSNCVTVSIPRAQW